MRFESGARDEAIGKAPAGEAHCGRRFRRAHGWAQRDCIEMFSGRSARSFGIFDHGSAHGMADGAGERRGVPPGEFHRALSRGNGKPGEQTWRDPIIDGRTEMTRYRIAVLMGGDSGERPISIRSGRAVAQALLSNGHHVLEVDLPDLKMARALEGEWLDAAFIAIHGGFGEDGRLQRELEALHLPYTGSGPAACAKAMNKAEAKRTFLAAGVSTPPFRLVDEGAPRGVILSCADALGYPLFVKPGAGGSSLGVSRHDGPWSLSNGIRAAARYGRTVLMEKAIPGMELTVAILGDRVLEPVEIRPARRFFDFEAKYRDPGTRYRMRPDLPKETLQRVQKAARAAHDALGCRGVSRVDVILSMTGTPYVLEVNTVPGLTPRSLLPKAAAGARIPFEALCEFLVRDAVSRTRIPRAEAA